MFIGLGIRAPSTNCVLCIISCPCNERGWKLRDIIRLCAANCRLPRQGQRRWLGSCRQAGGAHGRGAGTAGRGQSRGDPDGKAALGGAPCCLGSMRPPPGDGDPPGGSSSSASQGAPALTGLALATPGHPWACRGPQTMVLGKSREQGAAPLPPSWPWPRSSRRSGAKRRKRHSWKWRPWAPG